MPKFEVIKGGRGSAPSADKRIFRSATATDTRLMGVIGLEVVWSVFGDGDSEFVQLFYLDSEEYGIESYMDSVADAPEKLRIERERLSAALGGSPVPVNEREARFLVQSHALLNDRFGQGLPEGRERYGFMLSPAEPLSRAEYDDLMERICRMPDTEYYTLNHFMMRSVSGDREGAAWLFRGAEFPEGTPAGRDDRENPENPGNRDDRGNPTGTDDLIYPGYAPEMPGNEAFEDHPATLCKNIITSPEDAPAGVFMCQSLVEHEGVYRLVHTEIELTGRPFRVRRAQRHSEMRITGPEAAMQVNKSEFVAVYDIIDETDEFYNALESFLDRYTVTDYDNGRLYIHFNDNNHHCGCSEYRLNDDVHAMFFVSDGGQIVVMSYDLEKVQDAEFRLCVGLLPYPVHINMKYQFHEPVLYEFIRSDFIAFADFVEYIGGKPNE